MFFTLRNLSSSTVEPIEDPVIESAKHPIPSELRTKADRVAWANRPDTHHSFISAFEAVNPGLRVNPRAGNPAFRMHGLIADYDAYAPNHGTVQELIAREFAHDPDLRPNWIVTTRSDGRRLVWKFATPLSIDAPRFIEPFLHILRSELRLPKLLAGLDEPALLSPHTYYEIGADWEPVNRFPLNEVFLQNCFGEAVMRSTKKFVNTGGLPEIPMAAIHKEFEARFPGRLGVTESAFVPGVRGPAAWDPTASNPTSCVFYPHGAYRYSASKIFHSYAEIFGDAFVRQYERDRAGNATKNIFYFGNKQYCRVVIEEDGTRTFLRQKKDEVADYLKVVWGLNPKQSGGSGSEIDRAMQLIHEIRSVDGAAPFLWNPELLVECGGSKFLNCSNVKPVAPADETPGRWGERFPWTAKWLWDLYEPRTQLVRHLAWMRHSYSNALSNTPVKNLALFLVGSTNLGKTLWNQIFWPHVMGGGAEATSFLTSKTGFNKALGGSPHWYVDDARANTTERDLQAFTETLKAFVANPRLEYQPKFMDSVPVTFHGTICVTMNEDDQSLRMLPSLDRSVADKVMILKCAPSKERTVFHDFTERYGKEAKFDEVVKQEAPHFLAWLLQWRPPQAISAGPQRFGTTAFVHPDLLDASVVNSSAGDLLAVIDILMEHEAMVTDEVKQRGFYECTAIQLLHIMSANPLTNRVLGSFDSTARGVGMRLSKLAKLHHTRVVNMRSPGRKVAGGKQPKSGGSATRYRIFPAK